MTKKRKTLSPPQEGQSDICADLKRFIVEENEKCVKQIVDSNNRRLEAIEESLNFAMDSLTSVSKRQRAAESDITKLQKETADLRRRLQQIEVGEDRQQQDKRLTCLIFSGPALQRLTSREDAARLIKSLVQQYLQHSLDGSQVKAMVRLKNGKILTEFTTATPGSDRDFLFRAKSRLRGSGLYIAESLTPRRQAMFVELLQLKREGVVFSVFTRSGDVFACRERDSAPIRVSDLEAVRRLAGDRAPDLRAQGRTQARGSGGQQPSTRSAEERELDGGQRREEAVFSPRGRMEMDTRSTGDATNPSRHGSYSGPGRPSEAASSVSRDAGGERISLLDCAQALGPAQALEPANEERDADDQSRERRKKKRRKKKGELSAQTEMEGMRVFSTHEYHDDDPVMTAELVSNEEALGPAQALEPANEERDADDQSRERRKKKRRKKKGELSAQTEMEGMRAFSTHEYHDDDPQATEEVVAAFRALAEQYREAARTNNCRVVDVERTLRSAFNVQQPTAGFCVPQAWVAGDEAGQPPQVDGAAPVLPPAAYSEDGTHLSSAAYGRVGREELRVIETTVMWGSRNKVIDPNCCLMLDEMAIRKAKVFSQTKDRTSSDAPPPKKPAMEANMSSSVKTERRLDALLQFVQEKALGVNEPMSGTSRKLCVKLSAFVGL
ncbi:hypothetical protein FJT64_005620 [Amphibalanus amphitrite]|uniref:Uncharacterized protein n=1 Tax=Amphibalanus amphitrite TaxID=1232801 RepID=A0A6A4W4H9_AMPAM|nr:hypothetical protein FJT64_005620 [Amphibalanus amphitrite]